jgi:hypothetical protein
MEKLISKKIFEEYLNICDIRFNNIVVFSESKIIIEDDDISYNLWYNKRNVINKIRKHRLKNFLNEQY